MNQGRSKSLLLVVSYFFLMWNGEWHFEVLYDGLWIHWLAYWEIAEQAQLPCVRNKIGWMCKRKRIFIYFFLTILPFLISSLVKKSQKQSPGHPLILGRWQEVNHWCFKRFCRKTLQLLRKIFIPILLSSPFILL